MFGLVALLSVLLNPVRCAFMLGLTRGSDATACRGSDTLLLLNEASELEARLSAMGGEEREGGRGGGVQVCVFTLHVAGV